MTSRTKLADTPKSALAQSSLELLAALSRRPAPPTDEELQVLDKLVQMAQEPTTGQRRRVAQFLLAWWDAPTFGGFDLTQAWGLDHQIALDMAVVFAMIIRTHAYPDQLGYGPAFERIIAQR